MSGKDIEREIQAKGKTAPRITPEHINSVIVSEHYFTAASGVTAAGGVVHSDDDGLRCLTFCVLVLRNGFTVTGESACASPENFDAEIGRKIARENAINKIWLLEGYLLKQKRSEQCTEERMCANCFSGQRDCQNR
ncbi:Gp49 family protein [Dickeya sp. ws52]|uniref:Gp49 family protein n=1 Tax=Dickeya sp. ws52 TaxID=2576377 RepID=UPI00117FB6DE|nr:hypothetical protein FDP13_03675 [Dickeya sp. ws52]